MSYVQKMYWASPYWLKVGLAWLHTSWLNTQRYGRTYDRMVSEIEQRTLWSLDQWQVYQTDALCKVIDHAYRNVPYYRETFRRAGVEPTDIRSVEDLCKLPILEKDAVRDDPVSIVDERLNINRLIKFHTSGTTGTPLQIFRRIQESSTTTAFFDVRCHGVVGMSRVKNRSVSIGGHLVASPNRTRPPFWVYNPKWNQLYMSSYHLSQRYLKHYVDALRKFGPDYIEGYPSSVYAIAQYMVENRLEPIPCKACFTTAETLYDYHRQTIESAFTCPTYNQYGCCEATVFAAECPNGAMHISPDYGIVEVVDETDRPLGPGQPGHLICTSLVNWSQPFIRYRLGDIGFLSNEICSCGSSMPILGAIEGRNDAVLITRDGRRIGRLDPVFKGVKGVSAAQIVQNDYDRFVVRIVPATDYTEKDGQLIVSNLADRVGQARIEIEYIEEIERTARGKFKAIINNMADKMKRDVQENE